MIYILVDETENELVIRVPIKKELTEKNVKVSTQLVDDTFITSWEASVAHIQLKVTQVQLGEDTSEAARSGTSSDSEPVDEDLKEYLVEQ